ncbi:MAG: (5-formylfuran-3-yl)methyl phosphate synthase, partial [Pirellulales bacterium]
GPNVTPVAVIYADWPRVAAPAPQQVFDHAVRLGAGALLIDTCLKSGDDLLVHAGPEELQAWIEAARRQSMLSVVAGSLSPATIRRLLPLGPDYIAVRGAACRGSRAGPLDGQRLECLVDLVRGPRRAAAERFA